MAAEKHLGTCGQIPTSGIQASCGVQLRVPAPPAVAKKAVMLGTWQRGRPVLTSGHLLLSRPRVKV